MKKYYLDEGKMYQLTPLRGKLILLWGMLIHL